MHASRSRRFKKTANRLAVLGPWRNFAPAKVGQYRQAAARSLQMLGRIGSS